jgi:hypothetical protein
MSFIEKEISLYKKAPTKKSAGAFQSKMGSYGK